MRYRITFIIFLVVISFSAPSTTAQQSTLDPMIDQQIGSLVATYKTLHAAPELSHHEERTSAFFAKELRALGYTVTDHFGKYERPELTGYGVIAVMKNGAGPTVFVRTDLDALPVEEKTGLPSHYHDAGNGKDARAVERPVARHSRSYGPAGRGSS